VTVAAKKYQVSATMIVAKVDNGEQYLRRGAFLPSGVDEKEAKRLLAAGLVEEAPVDNGDAGQTPVVIPDGDPSTDWTVPQLQAYAKQHERDLGGARTKGDILTALAASATPPGDPAND
jgi:hypothetical protein